MNANRPSLTPPHPTLFKVGPAGFTSKSVLTAGVTGHRVATRGYDGRGDVNTVWPNRREEGKRGRGEGGDYRGACCAYTVVSLTQAETFA